MAAYVSDVAHQDAAVQQSFATGVETYSQTLSDQLEAACTLSRTPQERRERAIFLLSSIVGAMALSRATKSGAPELSQEFLDAVRNQLHAIPK